MLSKSSPLRARLHRIYCYWRFHLARLRPRRVRDTLRWARDVVATARRRRQEPRLTVAVDICALWEPLTGIGWYLYRLIEHLGQRDDVRLRLYGPWLMAGEGIPEPVAPLPTGPAIEHVIYPTPEGLSFPAWRLMWCLQKAQKLLIAIDGNALLHAPNYLLPKHFRLARGVRMATIHDLGFHKVPWSLRPETLAALNSQLRHTFASASWLLTDSLAVRDELLELGAGKTPAERVCAVHLGPGQLGDEVAGELPPEVPTTFALHVGTLEPRKNLLTLLEAWRQLHQQGQEVPVLVLCGRLGWKPEGLEEKLEEGTREGWLCHVGYATNEQVASLYHHACLVLFPSWYEGFGLPALEAQQAGVPLLCSDIPVLREVAGEGALYLPPDQPAAWAQEVRTLLADPELQAQLVQRGRDNVRRFSWQRCAEETLAVWRQAALAR